MQIVDNGSGAKIRSAAPESLAAPAPRHTAISTHGNIYTRHNTNNHSENRYLGVC